MDWAAWIAQWAVEAPVLAGSAAVVLLMIAIAWGLGFRAETKLDDATLARLADTEGAAIEHSLIAPDGRAALARLGNGAVLIVRVMGDDVSARSAPAHMMRVRYRQGRLSAAFADSGFPPLEMKLDDAPAWLADMAAQGSP